MGNQKVRPITTGEAKEKLREAFKDTDALEVIKEHPIPALLAALGVGFCLGISENARYYAKKLAVAALEKKII